MKWFDNLYVSPAMEKRKIRVKWKINAGAGVVGTFLLVLPLDSPNQIEIINAIYLKQKYYRKKDMIIIGMAESKDSAYKIVALISDEVFKKTGDLNIKKYLLDMCRKKMLHD